MKNTRISGDFIARACRAFVSKISLRGGAAALLLSAASAFTLFTLVCVRSEWRHLDSVYSIAAGKMLTQWRLPTILLLCVLFVMYTFTLRDSVKTPWTYKAASPLLAMMFISGAVLSTGSDRVYLPYGGGLSAAAALLCTVSLSVLLLNALSLAIKLLCAFKRLDNERLPRYKPSKRDIAVCAVSLSAVYLASCIMQYPGSMPTDTVIQFQQYEGIRDLDASSPLLITLVYGSIFHTIGNAANSAAALFACILVQDGLLIYAMTGLCAELCLFTRRRWTGAALWLFFLICPIWQSASQVMLKDVTYTALFMIFMRLFLRCVHKEKITCALCVKTLAVMLLMAFSRKASVYITLISCLLLFIVRRSERKTAAVMAAVQAAVYIGCSVLLIPALHIAPESTVENKSLMFQQMSYYVSEYGGELTESEKKIFNNVLDLDTVRECYDRNIVDPVKRTYKEPDETEMAEFERLYARTMLTHPGAFVKSLLAQNYRYFYPLSEGTGTIRTTISDWGYEAYGLVKKLPGAAAAEGRWFTLWEHSVLQLFIGPSLYIWMLVICLAAIAAKKSRYWLVIAAPTAILMLGLVLTHVNGEMRYSYPIAACAPFLLLAWMYRDEAEAYRRH